MFKLSPFCPPSQPKEDAGVHEGDPEHRHGAGPSVFAGATALSILTYGHSTYSSLSEACMDQEVQSRCHGRREGEEVHTLDEHEHTYRVPS